MSRNIEIKARLSEAKYREIFHKAASLAEHGPTILHQCDTFFDSKKGRLKLREFGSQSQPDDATAELIYYQRPDQTGPKMSDYSLIPCPEPTALKTALAATNGIRGIVKKQRTLFLIGQTRVHLDRVESLGAFLELEVVLTDSQSTDEGTLIAESLVKKLGVEPDSLIEGAYIDLLGEHKVAFRSAKEALQNHPPSGGSDAVAAGEGKPNCD